MVHCVVDILVSR